MTTDKRRWGIIVVRLVSRATSVLTCGLPFLGIPQNVPLYYNNILFRVVDGRE
jgi:hypothetical protein